MGGWSGRGGWGAQGCQCPNSNFCGQGGQKLKMSPYDGDEVKPDQPRLVKRTHHVRNDSRRSPDLMRRPKADDVVFDLFFFC